MTRQQPIAVLGGGSFGTAIANLLAENGHHVLLWMRDAEQADSIRILRQNPRYLKGVEILPLVEPTTDLSSTLDACELVFVALPSSALRQALQPFATQLGQDAGQHHQGHRGREFHADESDPRADRPQARIGVLSGPNLAREVAEHALTATVVASQDEALCRHVQKVLHGRTRMPAPTVSVSSWAAH